MNKQRATDAGSASRNVDAKVAAGFGDEWSRFDQTGLSAATLQDMFEAYFHNFPWSRLSSGAAGADFGCGSGRWAALVAPRVGRLYCVDASEQALEVAGRNLAHLCNCELMHTSVAAVPIPDGSLQFGYSLGVLHHIPDTAAGLASCVSKLEPGAPFLLYLYYRFDNRAAWYRAVWRVTELVRAAISRLPYGLRYWASQLIAALAYWPLARMALLAGKCGIDTRQFPLQFYADKPFYVMRTDALDRFGTRLEKRFTRHEMEHMMRAAGLERIEFNESAPFWCAVGYRHGGG